MLKNAVVALLVLALVGGLAVSWLLYRAGELETLEPVALPECTQVPGVPGAEDIAILRDAETAFLSSYDRRAAARGAPATGAIFAYDLAADLSVPRKLTSELTGPFVPHGISLWEGSEGTYLHVVNHPPSGHAVEIFEWRDGELLHRESVTGELLGSPNDVLAVGPRAFYVTNDHGTTQGVGRFLEDYLQRPYANVVYFDGTSMVMAAEDIAYANGINMSPDGREVYVGATTGRAVHLYVRDLTSGELTPNGRIELGTGVDNIDVDRHGMLWVAAHPKLLTFVRHAGDAARDAPSQVLWVDPDQILEPPVRTVFLSQGEDLSGASVGAPWGSRLLIGSVFEPHFLDCERDPDAI